MTRVLVVLALLAGGACTSVHPTAPQLAGLWSVDSRCGAETLRLTPDMSYRHEVTFPGGEKGSDAGRWHIMSDAEAEARGGSPGLLLEHALIFCDPGGDRLSTLDRADSPLWTVWEWGRVELQFSPDLAGFERK